MQTIHCRERAYLIDTTVFMSNSVGSFLLVCSISICINIDSTIFVFASFASPESDRYKLPVVRPVHNERARLCRIK